MPSEGRFTVRLIAWSIGLFALWWIVITSVEDAWIVGDASFAIVVVAALLASVFDWRRKAVTVAAFSAVFVLGELVAQLTGVRAVAQTGVVSEGSTNAWFTAAAYHAFRLGLPIAALIIGVRGDITALWRVERPDAPRSRRCPYCGKRVGGIEAHIEAVHGHKALAKYRMKLRS